MAKDRWDATRQAFAPSAWRKLRPPTGVLIISFLILAVCASVIAFFVVVVAPVLVTFFSGGIFLQFLALLILGALASFIPVLLVVTTGCFALAAGRPWGLLVTRLTLTVASLFSLGLVIQSGGLILFDLVFAILLLMLGYLFHPKVRAYVYGSITPGTGTDVRMFGRSVPTGLFLLVGVLFVYGAATLMAVSAAATFFGGIVGLLFLALVEPSIGMLVAGPLAAVVGAIGLFRGRAWAWYLAMAAVTLTAVSEVVALFGSSGLAGADTLVPLVVGPAIVWYMFEPQVQLHCGVAHRAFWHRAYD